MAHRDDSARSTRLAASALSAGYAYLYAYAWRFS